MIPVSIPTRFSLRPLLLTLTAAFGLILAAPVLNARTAADSAQQDDRLAALERENAALRAEMDKVLAELATLRSAPASSDDARLQALEKENAELARRIDVVADELQRARTSDIVPEIKGSEHGLGPAASKVYQAQSGVTIGGYGELLYENPAGDAATDEFDLLRAVLYFGYKFDEHFVFNSEIEFEHAGEEVSVEFAYLDYLHDPALNFRAGNVLVPMGFLNEMHEPTTFLSTHRPSIERFIIPSTWHENGIGVFGDAGSFSYRAYLVNGFDAADFRAAGLRDGRQNGSEAQAEDLALVGRLDYTATAGLLVGGSAYRGDSGQKLQTGVSGAGNDIDAATTIVEAHVEYKARGWHVRALGAMAEVDDVADLNAALGLVGSASIGEKLDGYYVELGYDLMRCLAPESAQSLTPFVRWESFDTQSDVPSGFTSDPANDVDIATIGVSYKPAERIVIKADYQDFDDADGRGVDLFSVSLGYIF